MKYLKINLEAENRKEAIQLNDDLDKKLDSILFNEIAPDIINNDMRCSQSQVMINYLKATEDILNEVEEEEKLWLSLILGEKVFIFLSFPLIKIEEETRADALKKINVDPEKFEEFALTAFKKEMAENTSDGISISKSADNFIKETENLPCEDRQKYVMAYGSLLVSMSKSS